MQASNYQKLLIIKRIRIVLNIILILLFSILFFLRWAGYITETPFSWKRPEFELIQGNEWEQKNDQLWVNANFNTHHSNVKSSEIWVDDNEEESFSLKKGTNTYIFKNLDGGTHTIYYEYDWNIFGHEEGSFVVNMDQSTTIEFNPFTDVERTESDLTVNMYTEGSFLDLNEDGEDSSGVYYVTTNFINKIKTIKSVYLDNIKSVLQILKISNINPFSLVKEQEAVDWSNILKENVIKQEDLTNGANTFTMSGVKVDQNGTTESFVNYPGKSYKMFPAGLANYQGRVYLVLAAPFNAYIWGIPQINNFDSYSDEDGDVQVNNLSWDRNNYDQSGEEYIQFDLKYFDTTSGTWQIADTEIEKLSDFLRDGNYIFKGALKNEEYFPVPPSFDSSIHWQITTQIKYGYEGNDVVDPDQPGPKNSNIVTKEFEYASPHEDPDEQFYYQMPVYEYEEDENGNWIDTIIWWNTAKWIDQPDYTTLVTVQWQKVTSVLDYNEANFVTFEELEDLEYTEVSEEGSINKSIIDDNVDGVPIDLNNGDKVVLRLQLQINETDWWNEDIGSSYYYIYMPLVTL